MGRRILVTGASGFLGHSVIPVLTKAYPGDTVIGVSRADYDLLQSNEANRMMQEIKPAILVHLAALSGGIGSNKRYPANYFYQNIMLTVPVFEAARQAGVKKLVYPMGGCSYPAKASSPIDESQMWDGYPQPESAGYSAAKKMGLVASQSFRQQYGFNSVVIIPGNMYGPHDNFRTDDSHVVPGMIRRYYEMNQAGAEEIVMWGSGAPTRDFVYVEDVARVFAYFIDHYDSSEPVNISTGTSTSIRQLAETIGHLLGFSGKITWDTSKPDGQMVKIFDVRRLKSLGLSCPTALEDGLKKTIDWFVNAMETRSHDIRL